MKTEYLFVILLVLIGFSSCEYSTSDATLELSQSTFENISSDGATLTVNITSKEEVQQQVSITITSRLFSMYYIRIKTILYNTLNKTV